MLVVVTLSRGHILSERTSDVPNSLGDLLCRVVLSTRRSTVDVGLDVGSRTTNFLRSTAELITMRSPVSAVPDVLHDNPQRGSELGVLGEHGADHAEEYCDITGKSRSAWRRRVEVRKRRVLGIGGGRGVGRRELLDVDS